MTDNDTTLLHAWTGLETITLHDDGSIDTTLGKPTNVFITNHTIDELANLLAEAPILITHHSDLAHMARPEGSRWGARGGGYVHAHVTPDGYLRNTIDQHTWVYELHRAIMWNDWYPQHIPPAEGWYIARWVD